MCFEGFGLSCDPPETLRDAPFSSARLSPFRVVPVRRIPFGISTFSGPPIQDPHLPRSCVSIWIATVRSTFRSLVASNGNGPDAHLHVGVVSFDGPAGAPYGWHMFGALSIPLIPGLLRLQITSTGRVHLKLRVR